MAPAAECWPFGGHYGYRVGTRGIEKEQDLLFKISVVALVGLFAMPITAAGQLSEGTRVRVKIAGRLADDGRVTPDSSSQSVVGRFLALEADEVILAVGSTPKNIRLPKAAITNLEISRGRSRAKGALIGAGVGGLVGVVWGSIERLRACSKPPHFFCDLAFLGPLAVAPPVGAIVGTVIGKPQWVKVSPTTLALGVRTATGGVQIGGTLKF